VATFHTFNLAKFWYTKLIVADTYALVFHKNIPLYKKKVAKTNQSRIGLLFLIVVLVFILVLRRLAAEEGT